MKRLGLSAIVISMLLVSGCAMSEKKMDATMDDQMMHEADEMMMDEGKMMDKDDKMKHDMKMDDMNNGM